MCQIDPEPGSVDRGSIIRGSHRTGDRRGAAGIQLNQLCDELLYFTSRQSAVFAEVNHSTLESCGNVCLKNRDVADLIGANELNHFVPSLSHRHVNAPFKPLARTSWSRSWRNAAMNRTVHWLGQTKQILVGAAVRTPWDPKLEVLLKLWAISNRGRTH